jgi:hypothetical protein
VWSNASWGNNTAAEELGVGLPFYGKNILNSAAFTYADILAQGTPTGNGYYTLGGQTVWVPDQSTIEDRVQLAHNQGLQHIIIWELAQDVAPSNANSMLRIAANKLASLTNVPGDFNDDGFVDSDDLAEWQNDFGATGGSDADRDGDSDGEDFLAWQRNLAPSASVAISATTVPEPNALVLVAYLLAGLIARPQSRTRPLAT